MIKCRICQGSDLSLKLDLGHHPPSDAFLTKEQLQEPETHYPLQLYFCHDCGLVQIGHTVSKETLFNSEYPYETGVNGGGVEHFRELAKTAYEKFQPHAVLDIGSNDGTLLEGFKDLGCDILGIEPVEPIARRAKVPTIACFWSSNLAPENKFDLITATNVFAHVNDLHDFMEGITIALKRNGVFIIEAPYLYDMLNRVEYDTIYHEHLCYLSLKPLQRLMHMHGMTIFDFDYLPDIHGGTMRYFIGFHDRHKDANITQENFTSEYLDEFAEKVKEHRQVLLSKLYALKCQGKRIVGVSAPAKSSTLLNYCGIGTQFLDYITEKSPLKIGKFTPGQHIPVVSDEVLIEEQPDAALLLAWNWKRQIQGALKDYRGEWILPLE